MIQAEAGQEEKEFISYIETALAKLAEEDYDAFLRMFDSSRMSRDELMLALQYLDESCEAIKIDNPMKVKCAKQRIDVKRYENKDGYYMDYDLTTDGQLNDLTVQIEFMRHGSGYLVSLEDLHTL